jgi:hypothetical protein
MVFSMVLGLNEAIWSKPDAKIKKYTKKLPIRTHAVESRVWTPRAMPAKGNPARKIALQVSCRVVWSNAHNNVRQSLLWERIW